MAVAIGASRASAAEIAAHALALAAGYKAAFLCSGIFDAGQSQAQIAADDLEGIYPEYQQAVRMLPAVVDRSTRTVSVAFEPNLPPRVAAWRRLLGCAQLPVGAAPASAARLPSLRIQPPAGDADARPWPDGDRNAGAPLPALGVVVARGRIVAERYRDGYDLHTPQRTWSVAKSLTATLIGRAVRLGLIQVDAPTHIPEWNRPGDPRAKITLAQLMSMESGLWTNGPGNRTDEIYLGGAAVSQYATAIPLEAAPGSRFRYANDDVLLAARTLRAALGDDSERSLAFPFTELMWRIGMRHTTPETDWRGNYVLSSQVWSTARDLARLGLLYLNDGVWDGERLLPEGWSRFVATPAPVQPEGVATGGPGYGALFWLFGARQGLPAGTYAMIGNRGQYVFVVPAKGVVIVRRGFDAAGAAQFDGAKFAREVLAVMGR